MVVTVKVPHHFQFVRPALAAGDTRRVHIEVSDGGPADREGDWAAGGTPDGHGRELDIIDHITDAHGEHDHPGHAVHWADVDAMARPRRCLP
ncbi:ATP-binding protein [Streptomyces sp. 900105755]